MLTPEQIRSIWKKIAVPFVFALLLLIGGLVMRSMHRHSLAVPGAFMCMGGVVGMLLFGSKAIQFFFYLKRDKQ